MWGNVRKTRLEKLCGKQLHVFLLEAPTDPPEISSLLRGEIKMKWGYILLVHRQTRQVAR